MKQQERMEVFVGNNIRMELIWDEAGESLDGKKPSLIVTLYINGKIRKFTYRLHPSLDGVPSEDQPKNSRAFIHSRISELTMRRENSFGYKMFQEDWNMYNRMLTTIADCLKQNID